jgi:hypothetical protein
MAALKSYLTVISGLTNNVVTPGIEHPTGSSGATTGAGLSGNAVKLASLDQVVAGLISAGAPFKSLEVGVTPATPNGPQDSLATVSHKGPNAKNIAEYRSQGRVHPAVHGRHDHHDAGPGDQAGQRAEKACSTPCSRTARACRRSSARPTNSASEQHLQSIRDIEARLVTTPPTTTPTMCTSPTTPTTPKDTKSEAPPAVNTAMADLSILALACDRTPRVDVHVLAARRARLLPAPDGYELGHERRLSRHHLPR